MTQVICSCDVGHRASEPLPLLGLKGLHPNPANHPIRFLIAQKWQQEVPCQLIHRLMAMLIKAKAEQMLERTGVVQSQGQEQFGEQRDGGQGLGGHGLVAAAQSVPL